MSSLAHTSCDDCFEIGFVFTVLALATNCRPIYLGMQLFIMNGDITSYTSYLLPINLRSNNNVNFLLAAVTAVMLLSSFTLIYSLTEVPPNEIVKESTPSIGIFYPTLTCLGTFDTFPSLLIDITWNNLFTTITLEINRITLFNFYTSYWIK